MKKTSNIALTLTLLFISLTLSATVHQVEVASNSFSPAVLNIVAGDTVVFTNVSGFHNVKADNGSFRCSDDCEATAADGMGAPSSNAWVVEITFNSVESFQYFCEIHGGMGGAGMAGVINVVAPEPSIVHEVRSSDFEFTPDDLNIQIGDYVHFINDNGNHNVLADDDSFKCSEACEGSGFNLASSASTSNWDFYLQFNEASENPYYCEPHGSAGGFGMAGIIRVQPPNLIFANGFE